jgi:predicted oxidoreductase
MRTAFQQHTIPERILALSTIVRPDYVDLFTVPTRDVPRWSPEQWARAAVDVAAGLRGQLIWRGVLGLRLRPRRSPDRIAGWKVAARGTSWLRLEAASWFLTAHLAFDVEPGVLSVATFIRYDRTLAARVWPSLSAYHRRAMPGLLRYVSKLHETVGAHDAR